MGKKKKKKKPLPQSIPEAFVERLIMMYGQSVFDEIEKTFVRRPTTFRINTLKATQEEVLIELEQEGFKITPVAWYKGAFILENKTKRDLIGTKSYSGGKIYVQSLASMVPPLVLDPQPGERVLDLTAAPGSKTSQIAAMMNQTGELVANDVHKIRFYKLKHNMEHLGVFAEDPNWMFTLRLENGAGLCNEYPEYFDKILVDAPCSSEARFVDGEPKSFGYWKERKVKEMAYKQRQLLLSAWGALKPGGRLVYSTCTFAPEENESQMNVFLSRFDDYIVEQVSIEGLELLPTLASWKGRSFDPVVQRTLRIMPTKEIEGFYVASISKQP